MATRRPTSGSGFARLATFVATGMIALSSAVGAAEPEPRDLATMNLEDLMNLEITSASKHEQRIGEVAAAITVLDAEDIRRSGVTSIPEALRLVPGMMVQRIDGNKWAISARGFPYRWANSLLVLIDGRSVYSPMFSGVYWDAQDVVLEDVERIEIIRGPGATVWGANAVTGVINILTKHASGTHGWLASAATGQRERAVAALRWGGAPVEGLEARAFVRTTDRRATERPAETGGLLALPQSRDGLVRADDDSRLLHAGARADWRRGPRDELTVQFELSTGWSDWSLPVPSYAPPFNLVHRTRTELHNGFALARWDHRSERSGDFRLQAYLDRVDRPDTTLHDRVWTGDIEFQHHLRVAGRHEIVWGAGFRRMADRITSGYLYAVRPDERVRTIASAFLQDEITLVPARARLTLGSKFEQHTFTGLEVQPTVRALWTPSDRLTGWAAWSRAVRAPSRSDRDAYVRAGATPGPGVPVLLLIVGGPDHPAGVLDSWQMGWRAAPSHRLAFDVAAFLDFHQRVSTTHVNQVPAFVPLPEPHLEMLNVLDGLHDAENRGLEVTARWTPAQPVRLQASAGWFSTRFFERSGEAEESSLREQEGAAPAFAANARGSFDLPRGFEADLTLRHVGHVPSGNVPEYRTLDLRLGWRPAPAVTLDLIGRDLFEQGRFESNYTPSLVVPTLLERSLEARITLQLP